MESNYLEFQNGQKQPFIGLGTWKSSPGQVQQAVESAIDAGYKHIDSILSSIKCEKLQQKMNDKIIQGAAAYGNETEIGQAFKNKIGSKIERSDLFVTSKLFNNAHDPKFVEINCRKTLEDLGLDYLDLYLMHWPIGFDSGDDPFLRFPKDQDGNLKYSYFPLLDTWKAMENLVQKGLTKSIGVSNFNKRQINHILENCTIRPQCNQIESNPYFNNEKLIQFCQQNQIQVTAYSPLGSPDSPWAKPENPHVLSDSKIQQIASKYNKTTAQIIIRFQIDRQVSVIPKSTTPQRISENLNVLDFKLSQEDIELIKSFNIPFRTCCPTVERNGLKVLRDGEHPEFPFHDEY